MNSDGVTLKGPPMAIRIRFWLNVPGPEPGEQIEKEFRHTIAIRSAPGPAASAADTAATTIMGTTMPDLFLGWEWLMVKRLTINLSPGPMGI
jgi:hypothetical protein